MNRQQEREKLIEKLNSCYGNEWPYCECIIDLYLHISYDDFDLREELMLRFRCMEVVDYLLTFLNMDMIKQLLIAMLKRPTWHPLTVLGLGDYGFSRELRHDILDNISRIYRDVGMEDSADKAVTIREMSYYSS